MGKILYVGGFVLPDKNAAAQRVVNIAKALRDLGHEVVFLNYSSEAKKKEWVTYFGFKCLECPKQNMIKSIVDISEVKKLMSKYMFTHVIAYNYPSVCLAKLNSLCKDKNIKLIADATEWYQPEGNIVYRVIKGADTEVRMKILHKKIYGVIAISDYLYQYYKDSVKTVKIPATIDISDEKWHMTVNSNKSDKIVFVYAGVPSSQKERLDLIVDAIETLPSEYKIEFRLIGITQKQFEKIYNTSYKGNRVRFLGRIDHLDVIRNVTEANWSIILRENNKVVRAGFPTKVVESIACGTPVIANKFSNIFDYLDESNSIICNTNSLLDAIKIACSKKYNVNKELFDYRSFIKELMQII